MSGEIYVLTVTAASIGFFHTLLGPDHYLPFIVMAKSGNWSLKKTSFITFLCGLGHVISSVALGFLGIALGIGVSKLEIIETVRGEFAAWALIAFGIVYFVWGLRRALKQKPHSHFHTHGSDFEHVHKHVHIDEHSHIHEKANTKNITPWVLFTIFVLGPCEPLIPILMYPAAKSSMIGVVWITSVFGIITIATMLSVVLFSVYGINFLPMKKLEKYMHAIAGATISLSGMAIQFLGL